MIITAILAATVIWCLFYSVLPLILLILLCLFTGGLIAAMSRHRHEGFLVIDTLAQSSRLNKVNPALKLLTVLILMLLCIASDSPVIGLYLSLTMLILILYAGGLKLHEYLSLLSVPVSFLLLSGLALLIEYNIQPAGVINLPVFHGYFIVSRTAQVRAALILSKALGAISCLYFLSLSTPLSDIINVLRRFHMPDIMIELMYLIYRYIFILLEMYHSMRNAAKSRLGYTDFPAALHTTGKIYSNLLARSYQKANKNFDAMESRCYTGILRFLEDRKSISPLQMTVAVSLIIITLGLTLALHK